MMTVERIDCEQFSANLKVPELEISERVWELRSIIIIKLPIFILQVYYFRMQSKALADTILSPSSVMCEYSTTLMLP